MSKTFSTCQTRAHVFAFWEVPVMHLKSTQYYCREALVNASWEIFASPLVSAYWKHLMVHLPSTCQCTCQTLLITLVKHLSVCISACQSICEAPAIALISASGDTGEVFARCVRKTCVCHRAVHLEAFARTSFCKKASNHHANLPLEMYSFTL